MLSGLDIAWCPTALGRVIAAMGQVDITDKVSERATANWAFSSMPSVIS